MMKKYVSACAALLVLSLPLAAWAWPQIGDPLVPFVLETDAGAKVDSSTIIGKGPIVISFVSTSCSSCNQEMTDMKKLLEKNDKIQYFPVSVDARPAVSLPPFKQGSGFNYTFLLDSGYVYGRKYGATFAPYTIIADNEGKITGILRGYNEEDAALLQKLLK